MALVEEGNYLQEEVVIRMICSKAWEIRGFLMLEFTYFCTLLESCNFWANSNDFSCSIRARDHS